MRKMEQEMARFRSQLISSMSTSKRSTTTRTTSTTSKGSLATQQQGADGEPAIVSAKQDSGSSQQMISSSSSRTCASSQTTSSNLLDKLVEHHQHWDTDNQAIGERQQQQQQRQPGASSNWLDTFAASSPLIITNSESGAKEFKLRFDVSAYEPEQIAVKTVDNRLQVHARRQERDANHSSYSEYNKEFLLPQGTNPELIKSSLSADGVLTIEVPLPGQEAPTAPPAPPASSGRAFAERQPNSTA